MATINGPVRTKPRATAKRKRADRPARDRLRKQAREVTNDLQQMGEIARDAAQEKLEQLRENASEYYEQGQDKVHQVAGTLEQFVRERPFKSIMIAAGVGLVFGRFWMRR